MTTALWPRQIVPLMELEFTRHVLSRRTASLAILAFLPPAALLFGAWISDDIWSVKEVPTMFAVIFQLYLRFLMFFGTAWLFTNAFRGEILDRSLHYYLLSPVRREVLMLAKFGTSLVTAIAIYSSAVVASFLTLYAAEGFDVARVHILSGSSLGSLFSSVASVGLACLGYGSLFLLFGLLFRTPFMPVLALWAWEWVNPFVPTILKQISVVHYVHALSPTLPPDNTFSIVSEPPSVWVAVLGLLFFSAVCLALSAWQLRRLEIAYGND